MLSQKSWDSTWPFVSIMIYVWLASLKIWLKWRNWKCMVQDKISLTARGTRADLSFIYRYSVLNDQFIWPLCSDVAVIMIVSPDCVYPDCASFNGTSWHIYGVMAEFGESNTYMQISLYTFLSWFYFFRRVTISLLCTFTLPYWTPREFWAVVYHIWSQSIQSPCHCYGHSCLGSR